MSQVQGLLSGIDQDSVTGATDLCERFSELNYSDEMPSRLRNLNELSIGRKLVEKMVEKRVSKEAANAPEEAVPQPAVKEVQKSVQKASAEKLIEQFYTLYMDPGMDLKQRLGDVTEVIKTPSATVIPSKNVGETDDHGFIYTKSNFYQRYKIPSYVNWMSNTVETYTNFYFPPYISPATTAYKSGSLETFSKNLDENLKETEKRREKGGKETFYDFSKMMTYRGNFTYRGESFKKVNDTINWIQWLFERVSGICSTYLTEWDLSVYMQEALTIDPDSSSLQWVELTHRMGVDNPFPGREQTGYTLGVVNCAVSKLRQTNTKTWNPAYFPLSARWTPYPNWKVRKSQEQTLYKIQNGWMRTYYTPKFYHWAASESAMNQYLDSRLPVRTRIAYDDFQGAALAGWTQIHSMQYYQALYSVPGDGLGPADIKSQEGIENFTLTKEIISDLFRENFGVSLFASTTPKEAERTYSPSSDNYSYGSEGDADDLADKYNSRGGMISNTEASVNSTKGNADGSGSKADENIATALGAPESADSANSCGIPQRTPPLYGGPHSPASSPITTQAYVEVNNTTLRNVPRVAPQGSFYNDPFNILSNEDDLNKTNYTGNEKFYTQAGHFGSTDVRTYEHSYTDARNFLNEGLNDYTWDSCYYYGTTWNLYYRDWYGWFPTYDPWNGQYIHYYGWTFYSRDYLQSGWYWWSWGWWGWYYDYYWLNWRNWRWYGRKYYWGNYGWTYCYIYKRFKKYRLHNMPFAHWQIRRVTHPSWYSGWGWNGWWYGWGWLYGYHRNYYLSGRYNQDYELRLPDYWTYKSIRAYTYNWGYEHIYQSWGEKEVLEKMVDISGGHEASAKLIFLEGNNSWSDRYWNGPRNIFQMKCAHKDYQFKYLVQCSCRHGCHCDYWYEERIGWTDYISVDAETPYVAFLNCNQEGFTNNNVSTGINFLNQCTVFPNSKGKTYVGNPVDFMRYIGYDTFLNRWNYMEGSWYGLEGYGILSVIPGIDSTYVDDPFPGFNYRQYISLPVDKNWTRLCDIPYKTYETSWYGGSVCSYNDRNYYFPNGGMPIVSVYSMDWALKTAWLRACTNGTFYIDHQFSTYYGPGYYPLLNHFYNVPIETPLRTFYMQMVYQKTYLEAVRELFCGHLSDDDSQGWYGNPNLPKIIDFHALGKLMKGEEGKPGVCGKRIYSLCDPNKTLMNNPSTRTPGGVINKNRIYGYNQWIKRARELFDEGGWWSNNQWIDRCDNTLERFLTAINTRINTFDAAIKYFSPFISNSTLGMTIGQIDGAQAKISEVVNTEMGYYDTDNMIIEETMYSYLNILYEYRKFFLNTRCNKQEGKLWLMRALESAIPILKNDTNKESPEVVDSSVNGSSRKTYNVVWTACDLSFRERKDLYKQWVNAGLNPLEEVEKVEKSDRLYVKVDWATEAEYNIDHQKFISGKIPEPTIVKVRRWDWDRDDEDGFIKRDSKKNVLKVLYGDYRYARKPANGKYRLENKNFKKWNAIKMENLSQPDDTKKKPLEPEGMDEYIYDIKWGVPYSNIEGEKGDTDILFNVKSYIELSEILGSWDGDPKTLVCPLKGLDYWEIRATPSDVPYSPLKKLFKNNTNIKLRKWEPFEYGDDKYIGETEEGEYLNLTGDGICPIIEKQEPKTPDLAKIAQDLTKNLKDKV